MSTLDDVSALWERVNERMLMIESVTLQIRNLDRHTLPSCDTPGSTQYFSDMRASALRLLRDLIDLRALGMPLDEARDLVVLRRATHDLAGNRRRDWKRDDVPLSDKQLQALQTRLRAMHSAYERQADNLARLDRWLTKRFTGGEKTAKTKD